ncbi:MAG: 4Fe-4S binding protein [Helicobacteraceae bacterium]|jgi:ferredoxin|nr:4Fe-4S binding protein [Helicobacteraceae bacterium]
MKNVLRKLNKIRTQYIWANPHNCVGCWRCVEICPKRVIGAVSFLWHKHIIFKDADSCIGCNRCIKVCPYNVFSETIPDSLKNMLLKRGVDPSALENSKDAAL